MQNKNLLATALCLLLVTTACKKSSSGTDPGTNPYKCTACITAPQALAANDGSTKGIYKGVVIGSSGTVEFNILNGGSTITARLVIDGATADLTSNVTWVAGERYTAPFTGTLNGAAVSITFTVNVSGSSPEVTASSIPGHPTSTFTIVKESSSSLIECFEGTYHTTKPEDGTFNIILSRTEKLWGAVARENGSSETDTDHGTISGDKLLNPSGNELGKLSGDEINGDFQDGNGKRVTLKGKRTL